METSPLSFESLRYIGEGNNTIVVSSSSSDLILRLKKKSIVAVDDNQDGRKKKLSGCKHASLRPDDEIISRPLASHTDQLIASYFGANLAGKVFILLDSPYSHQHSSHLCQFVRRVNRSLLMTLARQIDPCRPDFRKNKSIDLSTNCIRLARDATRLPPELQSLTRGPTLAVEIKSKLSRWSQPSLYCPCDLFSGDPLRMDRALDNLLTTPQFNIRVFLNSQLIFSHDTNRLDAGLDEFFSSGQSSASCTNNSCGEGRSDDARSTCSDDLVRQNRYRLRQLLIKALLANLGDGSPAKENRPLLVTPAGRQTLDATRYLQPFTFDCRLHCKHRCQATDKSTAFIYHRPVSNLGKSAVDLDNDTSIPVVARRSNGDATSHQSSTFDFRLHPIVSSMKEADKSTMFKYCQGRPDGNKNPDNNDIVKSLVGFVPGTRLPVNSILGRLLLVQLLQSDDSCYIDGHYRRVVDHLSSSLSLPSVARTNGSSSTTTDNLLSRQLLPQDNDPSIAESFDQVSRYLISSVARDCSLFIALASSSSTDNPLNLPTTQSANDDHILPANCFTLLRLSPNGSCPLTSHSSCLPSQSCSTDVVEVKPSCCHDIAGIKPLCCHSDNTSFIASPVLVDLDPKPLGKVCNRASIERQLVEEALTRVKKDRHDDDEDWLAN